MIPVTCFKGQKLALFGLGGSGLITAKALVAGGARVTVWDDAPKRISAAEAEGLPAEDLRDFDWEGVSALVLAPGVPLTHPEPHWIVKLAIEHGVEIIGDIELFCRERRHVGSDAKLIAITGTNGKSTTTALITHLLKTLGQDVQMGGNIGVPVLALEPLADHRIYVVECSSYQIDLAPSLDPAVGVLLNLSPDHLDRHGNMESYAAIKERLVAGAKIAVVGVDDDLSAQIAGRQDLASMPVWRIAAENPVSQGIYLEGTELKQAAAGETRSVANLSDIDTLRGAHNGQNAAAAFAALRALDLPEAEIAEAFESFPGLHHRMELVAKTGHILFVNDSKATNADAAARALSSFDRIYWIAGGKPKSGGIEPLNAFFPKIAKAYLIGEAAEIFAETLKDHAPLAMSGTLENAVKAAAKDAAKDSRGEVAVLLSPACASFDQFANFELRGEAFAKAVRALPIVNQSKEVA
ncbi:UDP-N-acetylmuramoyl-L-alanine--D-glutamate ligase [Roseibium limicola]|uniref:UDP-N-acetylmuramoylalanine--D-glutamate ligase n=1 Tax=Roseibium limicola TaxID=2816037 RepID=A0A939EMF6_9HYPH|nr:UDP-N-acetylmuramoyl-L-alanine--D-glutamate ligase [Roseibium limicola]MBO0343699.1 UDP-N-acetylmuramoyl-L-alanine--D-glutamate ligase [Roseibium limicola]